MASTDKTSSVEENLRAKQNFAKFNLPISTLKLKLCEVDLIN